MEDHTTIALDPSKSVFEIGVSKSLGRVCERTLLIHGTRSTLLAAS